MKKAGKIILNIILAIFIVIGCLIIFSILPFKNNYKLYTVMSGSMEPTIHVGSLIISKPQKSYKINDIITYLPASAKNKADTRTHRIVKIEEKNGRNFAQTKGDANNITDNELIPSERIIGKYRFGIPILGYIIGYAKTIPGLVIVIIVPATIIIYQEVINIKKEIIERKKKRNRLKSKESLAKKKHSKTSRYIVKNQNNKKLKKDKNEKKSQKKIRKNK